MKKREQGTCPIHSRLPSQSSRKEGVGGTWHGVWENLLAVCLWWTHLTSLSKLSYSPQWNGIILLSNTAARMETGDVGYLADGAGARYMVATGKLQTLQCSLESELPKFCLHHVLARDFRQVISPCWASVSLSIKWEQQDPTVRRNSGSNV